MKFITRKNLVYLMIILLASVFYIGFIFRASITIDGIRYYTLFDDAMISMRYARNLAEGFGLVWNPGEFVEGYSNLLWVIWMAVLHLIHLHVSKISLLVLISGAVILILNLLVVKSLAEKLSNDSFTVTVLSMIFTAFYYGLVFWTLRGMEVGFLTLLLNYTVMLIFNLQDGFSNNNFVKLIFVLSCILLLRADSLIFIIFFLFYFYFTVQPENKNKVFLMLVVSMSGVIIAQTIFRIIYYEDFLPNTYYLKLSEIPILSRLLAGLLILGQNYLYNLTAIILPVVLYIFIYFKQIDKQRIFCITGLFVLTSLYTVYAGGDAFEDRTYTNRFITVSIPLLIILFSLSLEKLYHKFKLNKDFILASSVFTVYLICIFVVFENLYSGLTAIPGQNMVFLILSLAYIILFAYIFFGAYLKKISGNRILSASLRSSFFLICALTFFITNEFSYSAWIKKNVILLVQDNYNTKLGVKLNETTSEDTRIAVIWAGAVPYYSKRYSIDLLGKTDKYIAKSKPRIDVIAPGHTKWDNAYSITKYKPDLILDLTEKDSVKYILDSEYDFISGSIYLKKGTSKIKNPVF